MFAQQTLKGGHFSYEMMIIRSYVQKVPTVYTNKTKSWLGFFPLTAIIQQHRLLTPANNDEHYFDACLWGDNAFLNAPTLPRILDDSKNVKQYI